MLRGMSWNMFGAAGGKAGEEAEAEGEAGKGDDEPAPWVEVLTVFNQVQATIAAARLEDEGIPVRVRHEAASSAIPVNVGILGRIDVLVPKPLSEKALGVLEAVDVLDGDDIPEEDE